MQPNEQESPADRKNRGAYYTDPAAAAALCAWALPRASDTVLDPSFGAGVFLSAAARQLRELGGLPTQVYGVEMDAAAYAAGAASAAATGVPSANLERRDFFASGGHRRFNAVVGNPPYVRFQKFSGQTRSRAAACAREAGVELSKLASSWAPFVVHSANLLEIGGRLAMLVPSEIGQARYGREVLSFLARSFEQVTFVAFDRRVFPSLEQDTMALLAAGRCDEGHPMRPSDVRLVRVDGIGSLEALLDATGRATRLDVEALAGGKRKMRFFELADDVRARYEALEAHPGVLRLSSVGRVVSGYVTGANAFFHLSPEQAQELSLPTAALSRAVFRARALAGLSFTQTDWLSAASSGSAGYLLTPPARPDAPTRAYLHAGEKAGIDAAYKTRNRSSWYVVPRVRQPDMLMSAMASESHGLVISRTDAAPANTLHAVTLETGRLDQYSAVRELRGEPDGLPLSVAIAWLTSLSRLSRELEGRVLGGGVLKLEPGEAGRVLLPGVGQIDGAEIAGISNGIDAHLRAGRLVAAQREADRVMLREGMGLSAKDVEVLRDAVQILRSLRKRSSGKPS